MAVFLCAVALIAPSERLVLAELEDIDRALQKAEAQVAVLTAQRRRLESELAATGVTLAQARLRADDVEERFKKRLRALVRLPYAARFLLLGKATSLADYLATTRVLRRVAAHDRALGVALEREEAAVASAQATLRGRRNALAALDEKARRDRADLAGMRRDRLALLRSIVEEQELAIRVSREKETARGDLQRMVARLQPQSGRVPKRFGGSAGSLAWPVAGKITASFGQRVELAYGTVTTYDGIDIGAASGSRVQAVAPGKIVYADWLRGYGQLVIVDHGDGYHTLMAHLETVTVAVGDRVVAGQAVGTVGDTGSLRGPILYFEVRHQGIAVDPRKWLRRE